MQGIAASGFLVPLCFCTVGACARGPASKREKKIEALIARLAETSEIGYGYSAQFSGSQFLPHKESAEVGVLVLGSPAPKESAVLEALVKAGAAAVPSLLEHLDDDTEIAIPPVKGMWWIRFADEYDYNRRTRPKPPKGVNRDTFGESQPESHTITVGDLCFVALGQIVNRGFNATRYQPTGGLVVSSPTYSESLCEMVRGDFKDFTERRHKKGLIQDFLQPDHEYRRIDAYRRLAFYYPAEVEKLVLKQLAVQTYDGFAIEHFVREQLYPETSDRERKELFDAFVGEHGRASSDGILLQLYDDLDMQERRHDARALLIQLYACKGNVKSGDRPYITTWSGVERARFIEALVHDKSGKIDKAVHDIFAGIEDDDYLALACMKRLIDRGYEKEVRLHCERRRGRSEHWSRELEEVLRELGPADGRASRPADPTVHGRERETGDRDE